MLDTSQIWWREITGPRSFILAVTERLQEASLIVRVPDDLPWRHEMRQEIESELREQQDYAEISIITMDADELDPNEEVASYILKRFALGEIARQYRKKSGKSIPQFIAEKQILKNNVLWIKGLQQESVQKWLDFLYAYHACCPESGRVVLEIRDNISFQSSASIEEITYSSLVSEYHLQLFCSILMDRDEDLSEDWKRYVSALAAHLCETDAEVAEYYISEYDHQRMEPSTILSEIAQDPEFSRRGASTDSRHILSIVRSGNSPDLQKRIWEAQLQILFPIVESMRITLIERIEKELSVLLVAREIIQFRERVTSPYDVEWGTLTYAMTLKDLNYDYYLKSLSGADRELIRQMRDLRNNLAHGDYCSVSQVNDILSDRSSVPQYA